MTNNRRDVRLPSQPLFCKRELLEIVQGASLSVRQVQASQGKCKPEVSFRKDRWVSSELALGSYLRRRM